MVAANFLYVTIQLYLYTSLSNLLVTPLSFIPTVTVFHLHVNAEVTTRVLNWL